MNVWKNNISGRLIFTRFFTSVSGVSKREGDNVVNNLFDGLKNHQRAALARSITLVESVHPQKKILAQKLLQKVLQEAKERYYKAGQKSLSFRIGLSGPPGAGKSTFLEAFGKQLTSSKLKVAVLAVDPSSLTTGGSLLGDKTRMTQLSCDPHAYIRPSPTSGHLGGVTRSTHEAIALCECSGYDVIFVETVGVGQSEYHVADMVDAFVLLLPPAGGDELQGIKKGIVELADVVAINKADGELLPAARRVQSEYTSALKFIRRRSSLWKPKVMRVSSRTKEGLPELWTTLQELWEQSLVSGELEKKRSMQHVAWMWRHVESQLKDAFHADKGVKILVGQLQEKVVKGEVTAGNAADVLVGQFLSKDR